MEIPVASSPYHGSGRLLFREAMKAQHAPIVHVMADGQRVRVNRGQSASLKRSPAIAMVLSVK